MGIPGSGKSTFYSQEFFHTHVRVNLDMLCTRNRERRLLDFCFQTIKPLAVDNTKVTIADRTLVSNLDLPIGEEYSNFVDSFLTKATPDL